MEFPLSKIRYCRSENLGCCMEIQWRDPQHFSLDPKDPGFYRNPNKAYREMHERGGPIFWEEYGMWCLVGFEAVNSCLRDKRFARLPPSGFERKPYAAHLCDFAASEKYSLLALEPPQHTRLRRFVNRAFVSRQIETMEQEITELAHACIDTFEADGCAELLSQFATPIPVTVIARLLGIPESFTGQLLDWSHAMVKVYTMTQSHQDELEANRASAEFIAFLQGQIANLRKHPDDKLLSHLINLQSENDGPTDDEIISVAILLLNAGHEATVHQIGNAVATLIRNPPVNHVWWQNRSEAEKIVAECMRHDAPLHLFTRYAQEKISLSDDVVVDAGTEIALLLGAANHCPAAFDSPQEFKPEREDGNHVSLGAGIHFCVGAPLAKLEMRIALSALFQRLQPLRLSEEPVYRDSFHFHGLESLSVSWG